MKTIRIKYKRRITSRYKNKKSKKCQQSLRQKKCKTKKIYHYIKNNKLLYQSGGEFSDDDDAGEEDVSQEDVALAINFAEPLSPRVKTELAELAELFKYRSIDPHTGEMCMEYPSKNTLFGKVLEEQYARNFFIKYFPDNWQNMFAAYLQFIATAEHDIPPELTDGRGAISIKSKRIGNLKKNKKRVTINDKCSFQICSADAVRFVSQILKPDPLTLVIIYYDIDKEAGVLQPDPKTRSYNIQTHRNTIWGKYAQHHEREALADKIKELSMSFSIAQNTKDLETIEKNIASIRSRVEELQQKMKDKKTLFKLAPKISSKCGKELGPCKHQCRLQVVLNVTNLAEAPPFITEPGSPTSFPLSRNAASLGFGRASAKGASARTPESTESIRPRSRSTAPRPRSTTPRPRSTTPRRAETPKSSGRKTIDELKEEKRRQREIENQQRYKRLLNRQGQSSAPSFAPSFTASSAASFAPSFHASFAPSFTAPSFHASFAPPPPYPSGVP